MSSCFRRQTPKAAVEQVTSITPRERPRSHMVPQPGNLALPIHTTATPRKRPSASNPQTPVIGNAALSKFCFCVCSMDCRVLWMLLMSGAVDVSVFVSGTGFST